MLAIIRPRWLSWLMRFNLQRQKALEWTNGGSNPSRDFINHPVIYESRLCCYSHCRTPVTDYMLTIDFTLEWVAGRKGGHMDCLHNKNIWLSIYGTKNILSNKLRFFLTDLFLTRHACFKRTVRTSINGCKLGSLSRLPTQKSWW